MKIGTKLIVSFAAVAAVGAVVGGVGFWGLQRTTASVRSVGLDALPSVQSLLVVRSTGAEIKAAQRTLLDVSVSPAERAALYASIDADRQAAKDAWVAFTDVDHDAESERLSAQFDEAWRAWDASGDALLALSSQMDELSKAYTASPRAVHQNYVEAIRTASNSSHDVLATFKTQVQEWKNILLRGKDPAQFDKYLKAFNTESANVQQKLAELEPLFAALGLDPTLVAAARDAHAQAGERYATAIKSYDRAAPDPAAVVDALVKGVDRSVADAMQAMIDNVGAGRERIDQLVKAMQDQSFGACADAEAKAGALLEQLDSRIRGAAANEVKAAQRIAGVARTVVIGAVVVGVAASLTLGVVIATSVRRRLHEMTARLRDIAEGEGDLTKRVDVTSADEIGELARWFNTFIEKVHGIMRDINETSSSVASASTEIAASNEEMSSGLTEQAEQVSQVSAATAEMSASSQQVAVKSAEGKGVIEETVRRIESISNDVQASAQAVNALGQKSEQIGQIIAVINDIADQTNLLALNAAIEAARAGEHGRGFAVVADEVRKLAERTTQATEQVGTSIREIQTDTEAAVGRMQASTNQVEGGVSCVRQAGDALASIVAAAEQQNGATLEISRSIEQINSVATQSREGAQQAAAAASQLSAEAEKLQAMVGRFRI